MSGIRDFELKQRMLFGLLNARSPRQLVTRVNERARMKYTNEQVKRIADSWRTWKEHDPHAIEHLDFLGALISCLHTDAVTLTVKGFEQKPYREIYNLLPMDQRADAPVPPEGAEPSEQPSDLLLRTYYGAKRDIKGVGDCISESQIDQRHIYLSHSSADNWYRFLHDKHYRQYRECVDSLHVLLESDQWSKLSSQIDGAVMLGAGTETKDRIIIDHFEGRSAGWRLFNYYIVDYSYDMLSGTVPGVDAHVRSHAPHVKIQRPVIADFCDLPNEMRVSEAERLAWFLPGGTIGNLNEVDFFRSMSRVLHEGELLIVGVEVLQGSIASFKRNLRKKYDTAVFRRFVSTPLRTHWPKNLDLDEALKNTRIDIVEGAQSEKHLRDHTAVPGAVSVAVSVPIGRKSVTLLFSTRYDLQKLVEFVTADRFGFSYEQEAFKEDVTNYRQLVFRRDARPGASKPT